MNNNFYTELDIINSLKNIGLKNGDNIFIHSDIGLFGLLKEGKNQNDYYKIFKRAIFKVIGDAGTMINPTFSYSFCKGEKFDPKNTPSDCGLFSNLSLTDKEAIRSEDANFSVVAIGENAKYFTENPAKYSFGKDSFWERFLNKNGKILFFNISHSFPTFIHYIEKLLNVPYRYDKAFKGKIIFNHSITEKVFYHYVNDKQKNNTLGIEKFTKKALEADIVRSANLGRGKIDLISSNDILELAKKEIKKDPAFLINNETPEFELKSLINDYFDRLWPINRSLTGNGNRETLKILSEIVDLKITEVPSGTQCFDWTVPPEWNIKEAWIKNSKGKKIVDFSVNNLHILGYSTPVKNKFTLKELKPHLFTLPNQPNLIPYFTSYYKRRWGFCLSHHQLNQLDENEVYEVFIDSSLNENGSMTIGEAIIEGKSHKEILFSTYICHPSMANNELSGPLVSAFIYYHLKKLKKLKYTYRFLFIPETIGSIYSLSVNGEHWKKNLQAGFVVTCVGDDNPFTYKKSRMGNALPDRVVETILNQTETHYNIVDFFPSGSDERQYCSPGFNLPVGSLIRTMYGKYSEYHTSGDNKDFISFEAMEKSILKYLKIIDVIERNEKFINTMPYGEPQLGKRGLYPTLGAQKEEEDYVKAMMWILNLSDGTNDLISISEKSQISIDKLIPVIDTLIKNRILKNK